MSIIKIEFVSDNKGFKNKINEEFFLACKTGPNSVERFSSVKKYGNACTTDSVLFRKWQDQGLISFDDDHLRIDLGKKGNRAHILSTSTVKIASGLSGGIDIDVYEGGDILNGASNRIPLLPTIIRALGTNTHSLVDKSRKPMKYTVGKSECLATSWMLSGQGNGGRLAKGICQSELTAFGPQPSKLTLYPFGSGWSERWSFGQYSKTGGYVFPSVIRYERRDQVVPMVPEFGQYLSLVTKFKLRASKSGETGSDIFGPNSVILAAAGESYKVKDHRGATITSATMTAGSPQQTESLRNRVVIRGRGDATSLLFFGLGVLAFVLSLIGFLPGKATKGRASKKQKKGLEGGASLIEILAVLAILVVITAIGFSLRGPAVERANVATCVNHLHSIGQSIGLYRADYDTKLPNRELQHYNLLLAPGGGPPSGRRHALTKYGLTLEVGHCPDFPASDYQYNFAPGRIDYLSRFTIDETERDPTIPVKGYVPRPTDVLVYDRNHINTPSVKDPKKFWSALREDGSVFRVPQPEIKQIYLNKGVWVSKVTEEQENTLPVENIFPGESWPKESLYDLGP